MRDIDLRGGEGLTGRGADTRGKLVHRVGGVGLVGGERVGGEGIRRRSRRRGRCGDRGAFTPFSAK